MMMRILFLISTSLLVSSFTPEVKNARVPHLPQSKLLALKNPSVNIPTDEAARLALLETAKKIDDVPYAPAGCSNQID